MQKGIHGGCSEQCKVNRYALRRDEPILARQVDVVEFHQIFGRAEVNDMQLETKNAEMATYMFVKCQICH
jgi:hypothetical protein